MLQTLHLDFLRVVVVKTIILILNVYSKNLNIICQNCLQFYLYNKYFFIK